MSQTRAPGPARCRRCFYVIEGLRDFRCPECGNAFDPSDPKTFTRNLPFVRWKLWLPGWLLSVLGGLAIALLVVGMGNWGLALFVAVPFSMGALLGYRVRVGVFMLVLLALIACSGFIFGLFSFSITGVFCGLMLAGLLLGPILIGTAIGAMLRRGLKTSSFSQRGWLPSLLLLVLPVIVAMLEGGPERGAPRSVSTAAHIHASPHQVWEQLVFYEEVERERPLLLRIGLPTPLGTSGSIDRVGAVTQCLYNKGYITKRVTALEPNQLLAFDVLEQNVHFEHDVELVSGSFTLEPSGNGTTLTLITTYRPLVAPRWYWRPIEELAIHTLHDYVATGIAAKVETAPTRITWSDHRGDHDLD